MPTRRLFGATAAALVAALTLIPAPAHADDAWLGVTLQELDEPLREALGLGDREGVLIADVERDSPADEAGLEDGDVIVEIDGRAATSTRRVVRTIERADPEDEIEIVVLRDGERRTLRAVLDEREDWFDWTPRGRSGVFAVPRAPHAPPAPHAPRVLNAPGSMEPLMRFFERPRLGVETRRLDENLAPYFGVDAGEGVLVLEVMEDTPAEDAGLLPGDVILRVDGEAVDSPGDLRDLLLDFEGETIALDLRRRNEALRIEVTLDEPDGVRSLFGRGRGGHASVFTIPDDESRELREELESLREELRELQRELREKR